MFVVSCSRTMRYLSFPKSTHISCDEMLHASFMSVSIIRKLYWGDRLGNWIVISPCLINLIMFLVSLGNWRNENGIEINAYDENVFFVCTGAKGNGFYSAYFKERSIMSFLLKSCCSCWGFLLPESCIHIVTKAYSTTDILKFLKFVNQRFS